MENVMEVDKEVRPIMDDEIREEDNQMDLLGLLREIGDVEWSRR